MEVEQFKLSFSYFSSHLSILTVNNIMHEQKLRFYHLRLDFCSGAVWKHLHERKKKKERKKEAKPQTEREQQV